MLLWSNQYRAHLYFFDLGKYLLLPDRHKPTNRIFYFFKSVYAPVDVEHCTFVILGIFIERCHVAIRFSIYYLIAQSSIYFWTVS